MIIENNKKHETTLELFEALRSETNLEKRNLITNEIFLLYYDDTKRYVHSMTRHIQDKTLVEDLIQEASISVLSAIDNFKVVNKDIPFFSYAMQYIKYNISLKQNTLTKNFSERQTSNNAKVKKVFEKYNSTYKRQPTVAEVANELGVREPTAQKYIDNYMHITISLDKETNNSVGDIDVLSDHIASSENIEKDLFDKILFDNLRNEVDKLPPVKIYMIKSFFGLDCEKLTLNEISIELKKNGIDKTNKSVQKDIQRTLSKLRNNKDIRETYNELYER